MTGALVVIGVCATAFALLWRRALRRLDEVREELEKLRDWTRYVVDECDARRKLASRCPVCCRYQMAPEREGSQGKDPTP